MILKLFRALMPKNADFVSALHEHSLIVAEAAAVLASASPVPSFLLNPISPCANG